jgi:hypothetical protein
MRLSSLVLISVLLSPHSVGAESALPARLSATDLPASMKVLGTLVSAMRYQDRGGDHIVAFSRQVDEKAGSARLQVQLWTGTAGVGRITRTVKDGESGCEFDVHADFIEQALRVTDLDGDGFRELTFAYRTTCTSDVSPFNLKLLMLEQSAKYALRGTTRVNVGNGELVGGDNKADAALKKNKLFLRHAETVWNEIVALNPWH